MKTTTNMMIIAMLLTLLACGQTRIDSEGISEVTVAFSGIGCEGECPFQVLSINNTLTAKFYGGMFADKKGYYKGKVSQTTWDSIQTCFNKFIVKGIDTTKHEFSDHPDVEFIIHDDFRKDSTKFIVNTGKMSREDLEILYWFMDISSRTELNTSDSLAFETKLQYPIPLKIMDK